METNNATLFGKMAAVMGSVRTLEKTGRNTYDKYDYVTADAIAIAIGREMAKQKLVLIPSVTSVDTTEYTTAKGGTNFRTVAHMDMTLACGDTGATWSAAWVGEAIDRSDKSISKAIVSATKYFLLKTFLLAGGDDDADAETPEVAVRAATSQHTANSAKTQQRPPQAPTEASAQDTSAALKKMHAIGTAVYGDQWDDLRHIMVSEVTAGESQSSKDLTPAGVEHIIRVLETQQMAVNTQGEEWRDVLDKIAAKFEAEELDWSLEQHKQARTWLAKKPLKSAAA